MGNYKFTISLDGDKQVSAAVNKLTSDMDKISASGAKAAGGTKKWLAGATETFKNLNPHLFQDAGQEAGKVFGKKFNDGFKQVLYGSKTMLQGQFPATPGWLQNLAGPMKQGKALQQFINQQFAPSGKMVDRDFWLNNFPAIKEEMQGPDLSGAMRKAFKAANQGTNWNKLLMGGATALFNPWIGSRLMSDAIRGGGGGGGGGAVAAGIFGSGGAMGFAEFYIAIQSFKKAVDIFWTTIKTASETAAKYYSSALQNGMGIPFTVNRQNLAAIMGVDEKEVFRFGAQMAYLAPQLKTANKVLSDTTPTLTQMSWNFKTLKLDAMALAAELASALAPVINDVVDTFDDLIKMLIKATQFTKEYYKWLNPAGYAIWRIIHQERTNDSASTFPTTASLMKQLPASSWEKMGLVMAGGGTNYARETANNTRKMARDLDTIVKNMGIGKGRGMSLFGMGATTNNP